MKRPQLPAAKRKSSDIDFHKQIDFTSSYTYSTRMSKKKEKKLDKYLYIWLMRTPGIAGKQANGEEMEWMWISLRVLHPKQLVFSTDVSFKERRMNMLELLPLKAVGFPLYLKAKAKATPCWRAH